MRYADRLSAFEASAVVGADRLADEELAGQLAELVDLVASDTGDAHSMMQDLRELAAVCLVTARRIDGKG